jgi:hypothetical protein
MVDCEAGEARLPNGLSQLCLLPMRSSHEDVNGEGAVSGPDGLRRKDEKRADGPAGSRSLIATHAFNGCAWWSSLLCFN